MLASVFFSLYISIVFFVMINIIVGIITLYFDIVYNEAKEEDRWKLSAKKLESDILQRITFMLNNSRCCRRMLGWTADDIRAEEFTEWQREKEFLLQLRYE